VCAWRQVRTITKLKAMARADVGSSQGKLEEDDEDDEEDKGGHR
jgi:hypothetical protein